MTIQGALLGLTMATGLILVVAGLSRLRHTPMDNRVLPYLRDLPGPRLASPSARQDRVVVGNSRYKSEQICALLFAGGGVTLLLAGLNGRSKSVRSR